VRREENGKERGGREEKGEENASLHFLFYNLTAVFNNLDTARQTDCDNPAMYVIIGKHDVIHKTGIT